MSFNIFDAFKKINADDAKNNTRNLGLSPHVIGARKVKAGAIVEMGTEEEIIAKIANDDCICLLLTIDKNTYRKVEAELKKEQAL